MATRMQWRTLMLAALTTFAALFGNARAEEIPVVTGEHWTKSSVELKNRKHAVP